MKRFILTNSTLLLVLLFGFSTTVSAQQSSAREWKSLFNGKDLTGWGTYLVPSVAATDQQVIGLNKDPHGVFTVENGMLRISGQDWGGVFTNESFSNYHLRFQVRFGNKKWAPRENVVPDGGLLFHCSMPYDFGSKCWMRSIELQIQESDIGDYHNVGAGEPRIPTIKSTDDGVVVDQYSPGAPFKVTKSRVFRSGNFESAPNDWTTGELIAVGPDAVFIVNGFVVNRMYNIFRADLQKPTTSGQLQFQSEGAEHYLRNIELRPVPLTPSGSPKLVSNQKVLVVSEQVPQLMEIHNQGEAVEIIAAELIGKNLEQYAIKLPIFPLVIKKGERIAIPVKVKPGSLAGNEVKFKLETVLGVVNDFAVTLKTR